MLQADALETTLGPVQRAVVTTFESLSDTLDTLDPAAAAGYATLQARLGAVEMAINALSPPLLTLYQTLQAAVDSSLWNTFFATYRTLLEALPLASIPSLEDIINTIADAFNGLLSSLYMTLDVADLHARLEGFNQGLQQALATSPIGQARQKIVDFLGDIRHTIESVPTEVIQQTVEEMLGRVRQELDSLGISQVQQQITEALNSAETFIADNLNDALTTNVRTAVVQLLSQLRNLPLGDLFRALENALQQLNGLIEQVENAVTEPVNQLQALLAQLDTLSFEPVGNEVIDEINEIKQRLQAINPNALSDVEKLAIKAALAVLEAIDLENTVVRGLKEGFHTVQDEVKSRLNAIETALHNFMDQIGIFDPQKLLGPVNDFCTQANALVDRLNARTLAAPLYKRVDDLIAGLEAIAPQRLLDPLQGPYDTMMGVVNQLDPAQWLTPLNTLYAEIDHLISFVDITPLMDELDRRQKALFAEIRTSLLSALDGLSLPEPLQGFFAAMRPVIEGLTDALFGDPATELTRVGADLSSRFRLTSLFTPLDDVFDRFVAMVDAIPPDDLVGTMNTIRETLGFGLDILDPNTAIERLRSVYGLLEQVSPARLLDAALGLPALQLQFEAQVATAPPDRQADVVAVRARFDTVITLVVPDVPASHIRPLLDAHNALRESLRRRINALDATGAAEAYSRVRRQIDRLLPDFLRSPVPLTHADILAGIDRLRPSQLAAQLDLVLDRFLSEVQPIADGLADVTNAFFGGIRDALQLVNPLTLKGNVAAIYDAIRAKVRILNPDDIAQDIRDNVLTPLLAPLNAINPATLKAEIGAAFDRILQALTTDVKDLLDAIVGAVEEQLALIRTEIHAILDQLTQVIQNGLNSVKHVLDQLEHLVFVDLLDRLKSFVDKLGVSFDRELDRVRTAFDAMLAAIPLNGSSGQASAGGIDI